MTPDRYRRGLEEAQLAHDHLLPSTSPDVRRSWWTPARRDHFTGYLFILPQIAGLIVFVLAPLALMAWYSLNEWNVLAGTFSFVGIGNYEKLATDPALPGVLWASACFSVGLVLFNLSLALLLAVLLNQKLAGTVVFRTIFFSPVVVSLVAWAIVWRFLLQQDGGINAVLRMLSIDGPNWLRGPTTAMTSVIVVQVVKNVGLNMVLFLAALQNVPQELYEAARVDGASRWTQFFRITVPLISPTVLLTSIITVAGSLQVFAQIAVLTEGGPGTSTTVLVYYLYQQAFQFHFFGYGASLAMLLLLIVGALTYLQWSLRKAWVYDND
ncbi:MAG: sugar transporter permease [Proteobacteria bacterium]|nr:sugar transporter permease [Pseudomonadota bacterium]